MHPYALIPLATGIASCAMASAIYARDPHGSGNRLLAGVVAANAVWATCELFWNGAASPESALAFARLAGLGVLGFAPLSLHLFVVGSAHAGRASRLGRWLPGVYAVSALLALLYLGTPWFIAGVERVPWGWSPRFGPAFGVALAWAAGWPAALAVAAARRRERPGAVWLTRIRPLYAFAVFPMVVAPLTEVVLPLAGVAFPRLGSASVALAVAGGLWAMYRYGYTVVTPGVLAKEIFEVFPDGVALLDRDGRIRSANRNLAQLLDREREPLRGRVLAEFVRGPDFDPTRDLDAVECELLAADGSASLVAVSSSALRERRGTRIGHVVTVRDLYRVVQLRTRLVTTGRLAAVGELAAAITHEINNPIAYIRSNLGVLSRDLDALEKAAQTSRDETLAEELKEGHELVQETRDGADRVAAIVRDVQRFSGAGYRERESVDVNRLCEEALRVLLPTLRDGVRVERRYGELAPLACAPQQLVQVFLNLLSNAAQAVGERGTITVHTADDGDAVSIHVEDDGSGIPAEVIERIFDPFFTTKAVGEGTGLGLAISRQIVRDHGGELSVRSDPALGTRFAIRLPRGDAPEMGR